MGATAPKGCAVRQGKPTAVALVSRVLAAGLVRERAVSVHRGKPIVMIPVSIHRLTLTTAAAVALPVRVGRPVRAGLAPVRRGKPVVMALALPHAKPVRLRRGVVPIAKPVVLEYSAVSHPRFA